MLGDDLLDEGEDFGPCPFRPGARHQAHDLESDGADIGGHVPDDAKNRQASCHMSEDAAYDLAGERLPVEVSLPGHDEIGTRQLAVESDELGDELESGDDPPPEGGESPGQAARGTAAGEGGDVEAEVVPVAIRRAGEPGAQLLHLFGRRPLLRPEHPCRVQEAGRDVTGGDELGAPKGLGRADHRERAGTPVSRGGAAAADHDPPGPERHRPQDELPRPLGRGRQRVVVLLPTCEEEPRRVRHLDHGSGTVATCSGREELPLGEHRFPERSRHLVVAQLARECRQEAVTSVREGHFRGRPSRAPRAFRGRGGRL